MKKTRRTAKGLSRAERAEALNAFVLTDADRPAAPDWLTNTNRPEEPMTAHKPTNFAGLVNHLAGLLLRPSFVSDWPLPDDGTAPAWIAAILSAAGKTRAELLDAVEAAAGERIAEGR